MIERQRLIAQLILHEGMKHHAYMDTVGKITVGVGRNLSDKGLTTQEVLTLLEHDIDECIADLASFPWFVDLDPIRQRVVTDLRFNLGPTRFRHFTRMLGALGRRDYDLAAKSMRNSLWARQVKSRADRLIEMMRTGADYTS